MTKTPPDVEAEIATLRAAGWSIAAIAQRTGRSSATIKRLCRRNKVAPGEDRAALIAEARKELSAALSNDESIRAMLGGLIVDGFAHAEIAREKALQALESLSPTDTKTSAMTMRALAAHGTMLKAHADMMRALLPTPQSDPDELPTLRIETLTQEAIHQLREEQRLEDAILNGEIGDADAPGEADDVVELNPV